MRDSEDDPEPGDPLLPLRPAHLVPKLDAERLSEQASIACAGDVDPPSRDQAPREPVMRHGVKVASRVPERDEDWDLLQRAFLVPGLLRSNAVEGHQRQHAHAGRQEGFCGLTACCLGPDAQGGGPQGSVSLPAEGGGPVAQGCVRRAELVPPRGIERSLPTGLHMRSRSLIPGHPTPAPCGMPHAQ